MILKDEISAFRAVMESQKLVDRQISTTLGFVKEYMEMKDLNININNFN